MKMYLIQVIDDCNDIHEQHLFTDEQAALEADKIILAKPYYKNFTTSFSILEPDTFKDTQ